MKTKRKTTKAKLIYSTLVQPPTLRSYFSAIPISTVLPHPDPPTTALQHTPSLKQPSHFFLPTQTEILFLPSPHTQQFIYLSLFPFWKITVCTREAHFTHITFSRFPLLFIASFFQLRCFRYFGSFSQKLFSPLFFFLIFLPPFLLLPHALSR